MSVDKVILYGIGVKGADIYTADGVGDPRLTLSVQLVRGATDDAIQSGVNSVLAMNRQDALEDLVVLAFQTRDIRGGKGERLIFHKMIYSLYDVYPTLVARLLDLIPEYGYWKDFFAISSTLPTLLEPSFVISKHALETDELACHLDENMSLFAKWVPKQGKSMDAYAKGFAKYLYPNMIHAAAMATYRRRITTLNAALRTVQTYMCSDQWDKIDPKMVPAVERKKGRAGYMNEVITKKGEPKSSTLRHPDDEKRMACRAKFQEFFANAAKGNVKISGAQTLYPHEVVKKMFETDDTDVDSINELNAIWAAMEVKAAEGGGLGKCVFMGDFSGSMMCSSQVDTPYWVSMAMCFLGSSAAKGPFKNKFMTFDSTPKWHTFADTDTTLHSKKVSFKANGRMGQGTSTNFQAAGDLLIKDMKKARTPVGEEPLDIVVVTDMGFDEAGDTGFSYNSKDLPFETHIEMLRNNFGTTCWKAPRITVWNVSASYSDNFQATSTTDGTLLLSGWSPSLFKVLCEEGPRAQNPYEGLRIQLDDPRYDPVRNRVREWYHTTLL